MANSAWEALVLLLGCSFDLHQELKMEMFKFRIKTGYSSALFWFFVKTRNQLEQNKGQKQQD